MSDGIILDLYADDLDKEFVTQNQVHIIYYSMVIYEIIDINR